MQEIFEKMFFSTYNQEFAYALKLDRQDMNSDDSLKRMQNCSSMLDTHEKIHGASDRTRNTRATLNLECAITCANMNNFSSAVKYIVEAVKHDIPASSRITYHHASFLYKNMQLDKAIPVFHKLLSSEMKSELPTRYFFESYQMYLVCLDTAHRFNESRLLFEWLLLKEKTKEEWMHMVFAFEVDTKRSRYVEERVNADDMYEHMVALALGEFGMTKDKDFDKNQFPKLNSYLKHQILSLQVQKFKKNKDYAGMIHSCTQLLKISPKENFKHHVHLALAHFGMKVKEKANLHCEKALKCVDSSSNLEDACSWLAMTFEDYEFLGNSVLGSMFNARPKNAAPEIAYLMQLESGRTDAMTRLRSNSKEAYDMLLAIIPFMNKYEQAYGASPSVLHERRVLNLNIAECLASLNMFQKAIQYTAECIKQEPPSVEGFFQHMEYNFIVKQFDTAMKYAKILFNQYATQISSANYFQVNQILIHCLDHFERTDEAKELFTKLLNKTKSPEEWLEMWSFFETDQKRYGQIALKLPMNEYREGQFKKLVDGLGFMSEEQVQKYPIDVQIHILEARNRGFNDTKQFGKLVESCSRLLELDQKHQFMHLVHRALSYYNMQQTNMAMEDCARAMQVGIANISLEDTCSMYMTSVAEVKFLRTTALAPLFTTKSNLKYKCNRVCSCCFNHVGVTQQCSRCKQVYYCNAACQKEHWNEAHKKECKKL